MKILSRTTGHEFVPSEPNRLETVERSVQKVRHAVANIAGTETLFLMRTPKEQVVSSVVSNQTEAMAAAQLQSPDIRMSQIQASAEPTQSGASLPEQTARMWTEAGAATITRDVKEISDALSLARDQVRSAFSPSPDERQS